ncbi:unnamed protein product [Ilex paraguariensis]|uniref:Transcriptional adapter 2-alpha/beta-like domain-containing protein n=1 Tax=Ilex paraguariensis TaxID=185542 RepID=A0ABC8TPG1_9AQUA
MMLGVGTHLLTLLMVVTMCVFSMMFSDAYADRTVGEKKPRTSVDEGPSMTELSGYNSKRREFEIEYDNDAEQLLADMEFKDTDTDAEHGLKLLVLRIYSKRLDERKPRKDFILERNLLHPDPLEKALFTRRERKMLAVQGVHAHIVIYSEIYASISITIILKDARAAGCCTSAEAERFIEQKRKMEAEETARGVKESCQAGLSGKFLQRANNLKGELDSSAQGGVTDIDSGGKDSSSTTAGLAISNTLNNWDVTVFVGANLLSEAVKNAACTFYVYNL